MGAVGLSLPGPVAQMGLKLPSGSKAPWDGGKHAQTVFISLGKRAQSAEERRGGLESGRASPARVPPDSPRRRHRPGLGRAAPGSALGPQPCPRRGDGAVGGARSRCGTSRAGDSRSRESRSRSGRSPGESGPGRSMSGATGPGCAPRAVGAARQRQRAGPLGGRPHNFTRSFLAASPPRPAPRC